MVDFSTPENIKKFGLDKMYDSHGNLMTTAEAVKVMDARFTHSSKVAEALFEKLNKENE